MPDPRAIAEQVFEDIRAAHATLAMTIARDCGAIELEMVIKAQPGLEFDVTLYLDNEDELGLGAGELWVTWFPCTRPEVVRQYREAVDGLLSGRFRILEYRRWGSVVKAYLQRPHDGSWQNVHRHVHSWPFTWLCTDVRALQNLSG